MDWNVNQDIMKVLDMMGLPMPGGNGDTLRAIAQDWTNMAGVIENQVAALNQAVAAVVPSDWDGTASESFHRHWQTQAAEVTEGVANFKQVAKTLEDYAGTVDEINEEILSIAEQILIATAAGAALTFFTAGLSDLAAGAVDTAEAIRVAALIARFTKIADTVGVDLGRMVEIVMNVVTKINDMTKALKAMAGGSKLGATAVEWGGKLASNFVADTGANFGSQVLSGQPITPVADVQNGALDAGGTVLSEFGIGKVAAGLGSKGTAGLANVGGGIFQSEAGGLFGVNGDSAFQNPFTGTGLSTDVQNLTGAATDGLGGAAAHEGGTFTNGRHFTVTDVLDTAATTSETSGTKLTQLLDSLDGGDGAMPVNPQQ